MSSDAVKLALENLADLLEDTRKRLDELEHACRFQLRAQQAIDGERGADED